MFAGLLTRISRHWLPHSTQTVFSSCSSSCGYVVRPGIVSRRSTPDQCHVHELSHWASSHGGTGWHCMVTRVPRFTTHIAALQHGSALPHVSASLSRMLALLPTHAVSAQWLVWRSDGLAVSAAPMFCSAWPGAVSAGDGGCVAQLKYCRDRSLNMNIPVTAAAR